MAGVKGEKDARYDLIPPEATWYEALVYGMGARKYAERNWEGGYEWGKTIAALERHIQLFKAGEDNDPESGLPHMAHARWHTGVILTFAARQIGVDDRPQDVALMAMQATLLNEEEIVNARPKSNQIDFEDDSRFERVR
jgi:hypothetical protein